MKKFIQYIISGKIIDQEIEFQPLVHTHINNFLLLVGSVNLFFLTALFTLSSIAFLLGGVLSEVQFIFSLIATVIFSFIISKSFFKQAFVFALLLLISFSATMLLSFHFASLFYDLSYDGQWYHMDMIIALAEGWNPVYQHISTSQILTADLLNSYPKMVEINQAAIYKFSGLIELSKMINPFLLITSFLLSLGALLKLKVLPKGLAVIGSILIVLNPVVICQLISFYIDGNVYALMICLLSLLGVLFFSKKQILYVPLICLIILMVNIKLTAILFALLFIGLFLAYCWGFERMQTFRRMFLISFCSFALSGLLLGFNPYLTNIYYYHHPLFPAAGDGDTVDFVKVNAPDNFLGKDSLSLLAYSTFAKSAFLKGEGTHAELKLPFTFDKKEVEIFHSTDPLQGGFGPLFSGAIIFTLLIFAYSVLYGHRNNVRFIHIISALIFFSVVIIAASFYARFVPQFWLIPIFALLLGFMINTKISNFLSYLLFITLVMNLTIITVSNISFNSKNTAQMRQELGLLREQTKENPIIVNFGDFRSTRIRFQEAGITFIPTTTELLNCGPRVRLLESLIPESKIVACEANF